MNPPMAGLFLFQVKKYLKDCTLQKARIVLKPCSVVELL